MKQSLIAFVASAILASPSFAEQTNRVEVIFGGKPNDSTTIPSLVRGAEVAGIGEFINQPTTNFPYALVRVSDYWIGNPGTNVVKIETGSSCETDWVFPTNASVVFFAITQGLVLTNSINRLYGGNPPPFDWSTVDMTQLFFPSGDYAWFRTTRDNGLLYEFATNLWDCVRTNPNQTRFYEVLRDADKLPYSTSSRLFNDTHHELNFLFLECSDASLIEKLSDPLIGENTRHSIHRRLIRRGWSCTNSVYYPPQ